MYYCVKTILLFAIFSLSTGIGILISKMYERDGGEILIDDEPLKNFDLHSLRENIALVSQDVFLFSDSIENNIAAGHIKINSDKVQSAAKLANAEAFISRLPEKYKTALKDFPIKF